MPSTPYSQLAETLIGSEIVKLGGVIRDRIREGHHIYNYTIGDFDSSLFPIPQKLEEEIINAYREGYTTYPPAEGDLELRQAVSAFLNEREGLSYAENEILISNGGRPLIYAIFRSLVDPGDTVIYPVPSWNNNHYTHFTQGRHVQILCTPENHFMPRAEQIRPHLEGATVLALCSPLNPTGTVFRKEDLEAICDMVIEENERRPEGQKKLWVLYDQIYWTLTFGETRHYNPVSLRPKMKAYTVFVDGISKSFAATGVRVGWTMGPEGLLSKIKAINSHIGSWAPMAEQKALARFLRQKDAVETYLQHMRSQVSLRLSRLYQGFQQLRQDGFPVDAIAPEAAIYLTVRIDLKGRTPEGRATITRQEDVTSYMLEEAGLALVPFGYFGADRESSWYRLSVGCCHTDDIDMVIGKLKMALSRVK